jgi:hypothetical protein
MLKTWRTLSWNQSDSTERPALRSSGWLGLLVLSVTIFKTFHLQCGTIHHAKNTALSSVEHEPNLNCAVLRAGNSRIVFAVKPLLKCALCHRYLFILNTLSVVVGAIKFTGALEKLYVIEWCG